MVFIIQMKGSHDSWSPRVYHLDILFEVLWLMAVADTGFEKGGGAYTQFSN